MIENTSSPSNEKETVDELETTVRKIVASAIKHSIYAENVDTRTNAYLDGVRYGSYTALEPYLATQPTTHIVSDVEGKLFSAFIKSLLDSGAYTITQLKEKDAQTMTEAYNYWVDSLQEYPLAVVGYQLRDKQQVDALNSLLEDYKRVQHQYYKCRGEETKEVGIYYGIGHCIDKLTNLITQLK